MNAPTCYYCEEPAMTTVGTWGSERRYCRSCFEIFAAANRSKDPVEEMRARIDITPAERSLSDDEIVNELVELRKELE